MSTRTWTSRSASAASVRSGARKTSRVPKVCGRQTKRSTSSSGRSTPTDAPTGPDRMEYAVLDADADAASLGCRGHLPAEIAVHIADKRPCVTLITVGELAKGIELRNWGLRSQATFEAWLSGFAVIGENFRSALIWGRLSANGVRKGR